jgi:hypothetical protein
MAYPCSGVHTIQSEMEESKTFKEMEERLAAFPREALGQGVDGKDAVESAHATARAAAATFCSNRSCPAGTECVCTDIEYEKEPLHAGKGGLGATIILQIKSITCKCQKPKPKPAPNPQQK